ncbi:hypothetical protein ACFMPD_13730 [Sedimentitalea sp. HM32M-2]|uniref:hypothetical protein n=1 Tax=Sedimentitalea sp. HM32M-2 TaxID=3351566 RepID=UPI00362F1969
MSLADPQHRAAGWRRLFFRIPVIGWVAKDLLHGDKDNVWFALIAFFSLWMSLWLVFGLPGLYLPALAMVPVMFALLVLISRG